MGRLKTLKINLRKLKKEKKFCKNSKIKFYNFWEISNLNDFWFYKFLASRKISPSKGSLAFFSVFGPRYNINLVRSKVKIFFTGENVDRFPNYKDNFINKVDLSLGFDYLDHINYFRFPLWILYIIPPDASYEDIKRIMNKISNYDYRNDNTREKFCSIVASHDTNGMRSQIVNLLNKKQNVDCAGSFLNNTSDLITVFKDNKTEFLKSYKFNICSENSNRNGYVTEKIFHSFLSGCIPIYWGSDNNPEPDVINKKSVLFYNETDNGEGLARQVNELYEKESMYKDFIAQEKFLPNSAEYICELINSLELKIRKLL